MGKLVAVVAASEMTREYLIKQKILPDHINVADHRMEAENRSPIEKSLMEEINELKKKAETKS